MQTKEGGKLLRLFRLIQLLAESQRGYTVQELKSVLNVSFKTVYRDLDILSACGFETLRSDTNRYRLARVTDQSDKIGFRQDESDLLLQAVSSLPDSPLRQLILEKLQALSHTEHKVKTSLRTYISHHLAQIQTAIRTKKQVVLLNYFSANSNSVRNRLVEPYALTDNATAVQCYEPASKENKVFKLDRIGEVAIQQSPWQGEHRHLPVASDFFGFPLREPVTIELELSELASRILQEEHPLSSNALQKLPNGTYHLLATVNGYKAIARFVLGLPDHIRVLNSDDFRIHLQSLLNNSILLD